MSNRLLVHEEKVERLEISMKVENGPICKRRNAAKFLLRTKEAGKITPWGNFGQCEGFSWSFTRRIDYLDVVKKKKTQWKQTWKKTIGEDFELFLDMDDLSVADAGLDGGQRSHIIWKVFSGKITGKIAITKNGLINFFLW